MAGYTAYAECHAASFLVTAFEDEAGRAEEVEERQRGGQAAHQLAENGGESRTKVREEERKKVSGAVWEGNGVRGSGTKCVLVTAHT